MSEKDDERSPAVRAISAHIEAEEEANRAATTQFFETGLISHADIMLKSRYALRTLRNVRKAVIAAEREAAEADARKRKEAIIELNAEAEWLGLE